MIPKLKIKINKSFKTEILVQDGNKNNYWRLKSFFMQDIILDILILYPQISEKCIILFHFTMYNL